MPLNFMSHLPVLYRDEHFIAVNKPADLLVHRTYIDRERDVALQRVRDQIGQRVYPLHRLDRATSGVLVFGLSPEAAGALAEQVRGREIRKDYLAVVRGWPQTEGLIERPLKNRGSGEMQDARTAYRRLETVQLPIPVARWPTARYALVGVSIETGRRHQIRRHLAGINHPVVGDTTHGDGRHNRIFREHFRSRRLLLHAERLQFRQPFTGETVEITAPLPEDFAAVLDDLGWGLRSPHGTACVGEAGQS
jgi:tRNA pseudouridine65 synthase